MSSLSTVLRRIKGDEKLKVVPEVIMTSSREVEDVAKGYQLGVNAYLIKPVECSRFVDAVKDHGFFWAIIISL